MFHKRSSDISKKQVALISKIPPQEEFASVYQVDPNSGKGIDTLAGETMGSSQNWRMLAMRNIDQILSWDMEATYIASLDVPDNDEYRYV